MATYEFSRGKTIMCQGDPSDKAYMIVSGKVEVYRKKASGEEQHLAFLSKGQIIGEYGVIDKAPRTACVRAIEHTVLRTIKIDLEEDAPQDDEEEDEEE